MNTKRPTSSLYFLWHPGTEDIFSGYGLRVLPGRPERLAGLLLVDRPQPVDPAWLARVKETFGGYELQVMTVSGERGIACQMWVAPASLSCIRRLKTPLAAKLARALVPLHQQLPQPQLKVRWDSDLQLWVSEFQ